jgi:hypothetical protein
MYPSALKMGMMGKMGTNEQPTWAVVDQFTKLLTLHEEAQPFGFFFSSHLLRHARPTI